MNVFKQASLYHKFMYKILYSETQFCQNIFEIYTFRKRPGNSVGGLF